MLLYNTCSVILGYFSDILSYKCKNVYTVGFYYLFTETAFTSGLFVENRTCHLPFKRPHSDLLSVCEYRQTDHFQTLELFIELSLFLKLLPLM